MNNPRFDFYHLTRSSLEDALPGLLDKASKAGHRMLVLAGSRERVDQLDSLLWTWRADSWLPHGRAGDGDEALQPILLTDGEVNANAADVLVLLDGMTPPAEIGGYARCLTVFDGKDEAALGVARGMWRQAKQSGHEVHYHQQGEGGGWMPGRGG